MSNPIRITKIGHVGQGPGSAPGEPNHLYGVQMLGSIVLFLLLRRRLGSADGRRIASTLTRTAAAATLTAAAAWATAEGIAAVIDVDRPILNLVQVVAAALDDVEAFFDDSRVNQNGGETPARDHGAAARPGTRMSLGIASRIFATIVPYTFEEADEVWRALAARFRR